MLQTNPRSCIWNEHLLRSNASFSANIIYIIIVQPTVCAVADALVPRLIDKHYLREIRTVLSAPVGTLVIDVKSVVERLHTL